jgi:hypothetical protein
MPSESANTETPTVRLSRAEWTTRRAAHIARVREWTSDRVTRASRGVKHPVYDFLFTYYSFRPSHLERWSPGADIILEDASAAELDWPLDATEVAGGYAILSKDIPERRRDYLKWATHYLERVNQRPATFNCYGLHEWAMLYRSDAPRHTEVALRLSGAEIDQVVERSELRCTHFDAYRFFTPSATPLNRSVLNRELTTEFDQPGCIHVTMDLYKFAHKIAPWCPSEVIADAFLLAASAREIDMRASPYDLGDYGLTPIKIESPDGRAEYILAQRELSERAAPIRARLLEIYRALTLKGGSVKRGEAAGL